MFIIEKIGRQKKMLIVIFPQKIMGFGSLMFLENYEQLFFQNG